MLLDTHTKRALLVLILAPLIVTIIEHPSSSSSFSSYHWHTRGGPPMLKLTSREEHHIPRPTHHPTRRTACVDDGGFYQGRWVHAPNVSRPHTHIRLKAHAFTRDEVAFRKQYPLQDGWEKYHLPWNQYDFAPHEPMCALKAWNRTEACMVLDRAMQRSRRVLFVGDSMSFTHAVSFTLMMGGEMASTNQASWREQSLCEDVLTKPIRVHFIRNDALYTSPIRLTSWEGKHLQLNNSFKIGTDFKTSRPWTAYYEIHRPEIVVLNLGLHIHSLEFFRVALDDTLAYLAQSRQADRHANLTSPHLYWRTTSAGHPDCWEYTEPKEQKWVYEGKYNYKFTWHLIDDFNAHMAQRIHEVLPEDDVTVMHLDQVSKHRPDGHLGKGEGREENPDCLHYHLPGVPDWWSRVFVDVVDAVYAS